MKQITTLFALVLAACANLGQPASVGMSIAEFQQSCGNSESFIDVWGDELVGECAGKPDEYVVFQGGSVERVLSSVGMTDVLIGGACENNSSCAKEAQTLIAKRTAAKGEMRRAQIRERRAQLGAALSAFGESYSNAAASNSQAGSYSYGNSPTYSRAKGYTTTCFFKRESTSGMNKICYYDCLGSLTAVTQAAVSLCQQSITR